MVDPNGNAWWNPFSWFDNVSNIGEIIIGVVVFIGAVVLTIATGGALAPMFITLGVGLAIKTLIWKFITDVGTPASALALPATNSGVKITLQATKNLGSIRV